MLIIYITCSNKKEAKKIASQLLKKKLIACANWWPIESLYRWKGKVVNDKEVVLICKTLRKNYKKVEQEVKRLHSYEVPCICGWRAAEVENKYFNWLKSCIK